MTSHDEPVVGSGVVLNIHMEPMSGHSLSSVEWEAEVGSNNLSSKTMVIKKSEATKQDDDNYHIAFNTAKIGSGKYYVILTAHIPDGHFPDGTRTEVRLMDPNVTVLPRKI